MSQPRAAFWLSCASLALGVVVWQGVALNVSALILASPAEVARKLVVSIASGELPRAFAGSLAHLLAGYGIAVLIALPLGVLMGRVRAVGYMLDPLVSAIYAIPSVAFVPFLIIWFGFAFEARVALVTLMCVFDMLVAFSIGSRNVPPSLIDVGRSFSAPPSTVVLKIILPAVLPFVFTGLRLGLVRAIHGMIIAELFFAAVNLGAIMKREAMRFDAAGVLVIVLALALFGLAAQHGLKLVETRLLVRSGGTRA